MKQLRRACVFAFVASLALAYGWARSPLGLMLENHFGVAVLEEATNPSGTLFMLLEGLPDGNTFADVEAATTQFLREVVLDLAVVVYPATSYRGPETTHEATVARKPASGIPSATTQAWSALVEGAHEADASGALSTDQLVYRHGTSAFLSAGPTDVPLSAEGSGVEQAADDASAPSPISRFLQEHFGATVVEEAANPQGTLFVLLDTIPESPGADAIEAAVSEFARGQAQRVTVIVYPKSLGTRSAAAYAATTVVRTAGGRTLAATKAWLDFIWAGELAGAAGGLKVADLTYSYGSTTFLDDPVPPPPASRITSSPAYTPPTSQYRSTPSYTPPSYRSTPSYSTPQTTCTSSTTSTGSTLRCYTGGRLTYESVCTIDSRFNVTCRSTSY